MKYLIALLPCLALLSTTLRAQTPPATNAAPGAPDEQTLSEITAIRNGMVDALNKNDMEHLLPYLHPDIVVTWANAEVSHGPAEVRQYYEKMMTGPDKRVDSVSIAPVVEGRQLYGPNVLISYGSLGDHFKLTDGSDLPLNSRFSSLLVKENGKWLIKGFHASANVFDNPILSIVAKRVALWSALISGVIGAAIGFIGGKLLRKRA